MVDNVQIASKMLVLGITKTKAAENLGISRVAFDAKLKNKSRWSVPEAKNLAILLSLSDSEIINIFFANKVN